MKRTNFILTLKILLLLSLVACIPTKPTELEFEIKAGSGLSAVESVNFEGFQKIIMPNCNTCHNGSSAGDFNAYKTPKDWIDSGLIIPGDANNSSVYYRLKGSLGTNGSKNMPKGFDLKADEVAYISKYITQLKQVEDDKVAPTASLNLMSVSTLVDSVSLSWSAGTDGGSGVLGYEIYRNGTLLKFIESVTTFQDTGLGPFTTYQYFVITVDGAGNKSVPGNILTVKTLAVAGFAGKVLSFGLTDADTKLAVASQGAITSSASLLLYKIAEKNLTLIAATSGTIGSVVYYLNGTQVRVDNAAPFSLTPENGTKYDPYSFADGALTVRAVPYSKINGTGEAGAPLEVILNVKKAEPVVNVALNVTIASPGASTLTNKISQAISGDCTSTYLVLVTGSIQAPKSMTCAAGKYSMVVDLTAEDGVKTIAVKQEEGASKSEKFVSMTLDMTAPLVTFTEPMANSMKDVASVSVKGVCETGRVLRLAGTGVSAAADLTCNGQFSGTVALTAGDGVKEITATQTDAAGNTGVGRVSVTFAKMPEQPTTYDFKVVKGILDAKCMACHNGSTGASNFSTKLTESDWAKDTFFIKVGDPLNSVLYYRLKGSEGSLGPKNMPSGGTLTTTEVTYIKGWITGLKPYVPPVVVIPDEPSTGNTDASSLQLRLGDAHYITNFFYRVFGKGTTVTGLVMNNVQKQKDNFGGGCDIYDSTRKADKGLEFPDYGCYGTASTVVQVPGSQTLREANRIKTCELIVKDNVAIDFALKNIGAVGTTAPNSATLKKAYNLFYPVDEPSAELLNSLSALAGVKSTAYESWRVVFLGLCHSPEWQVP